MARIDPVRGDKELVAALRVLSRGLPGKDIDDAVREAADPMLQAWRQNAKEHRQPGRRPKGGHVDEGIEFRRQTGGSRTRRRYLMGGMRRALSLLHLLEFGTRPHHQPKRGIFHPGARAFPVGRRAFDEHKDGIPERFGRAVWHRMQAMVMRLSSGAPARRR